MKKVGEVILAALCLLVFIALAAYLFPYFSEFPVTFEPEP